MPVSKNKRFWNHVHRNWFFFAFISGTNDKINQIIISGNDPVAQFWRLGQLLSLLTSTSLDKSKCSITIFMRHSIYTQCQISVIFQNFRIHKNSILLKTVRLVYGASHFRIIIIYAS